MQYSFDEWLEAKLRERTWQAADLARAGIDEDHPRGFDPGLISRWLKPAPLGVVPLKPTLDRLARALAVPQAEVYEAAGRLPPDGATVTDRPVRPPRLTAFLAQVEAAFHAMTAQDWDVRESAGRALFAVPPTAANEHSNRRAHDRRKSVSTRSNDPENTATDSPNKEIASGWPRPSIFKHAALTPAFIQR